MRAVSVKDLGRVVRDIAVKLEAHTQIRTILERAQRLGSQLMRTKNKPYALHALSVECIGKGKAWQR